VIFDVFGRRITHSGFFVWRRVVLHVRATHPAKRRATIDSRRSNPVSATASLLDRNNALPLDAAEGRCSRMELRNRLARIDMRSEDGQTMTEYGVLLALIAVGVIAVLIVLGPKIADAFTSVSNSL
jgi:pilus assembly protein Flp/PilA